MANYVFDKAKCKCMISVNSKGTIHLLPKGLTLTSGINKSNGIVCTDNYPMMSGQCNSPANPGFAAAAAAGNLPPCIPVFSEKWINTGICRTKFLGREALLDKAVLICNYGGIVKITDPHNSKVNNNRKANDFSLKGVHDTLANLKKNGDITPEAEMLLSAPLCELTEDNYNDVMNESKAESCYDTKESITQSEVVNNIEKNVNPPSYFSGRDIGLCSGKCPKGAEKSCMFAQTFPSDYVILDNANNSNKLEDNLVKVRNPEDEETLKRINECRLYGNIKCRSAYHHLLSGNQCLNTNKGLVMLANFYGYDVNNPNNGICLPSIEKIDRNIPVSKEEWDRAKIETMKQTERQLHLGQHSYGSNFTLTESGAVMRNDGKSVKKYLCNDKGLMDYETVVNSDLEELLDQVKSNMNLDESCRMRGGEAQRKAEAEKFCKAMDKHSQIIKKSILAFPGKRTSGQRYYVSYIAMLYDNSKNGDFADIESLL